MLDGANNLKTMFTNSLNTDESLLIHQSDADYGIHFDALGSIRVYTSTSGQIAEHLVYAAYGSPIFDVNGFGGRISENISATGSSLAFSGREYDGESGFLFLRERQTYDPLTGRFFQQDPLGAPGVLKVTGNSPAGDAGNTYQYAFNSPENFTDRIGAAPALIFFPRNQSMLKTEFHTVTFAQFTSCLKSESVHIAVNAGLVEVANDLFELGPVLGPIATGIGLGIDIGKCFYPEPAECPLKSAH